MIDLDTLEVETTTGRRPFLGNAVKDGVIRYLSVTSAMRGDVLSDGGCPLKWNLRYVQGDKALEDKTIASAIGDQLHKENAAYLHTGVPALSDLAMTGRYLLSDPSAVRDGLVRVETPIDSHDGGEQFAGTVLRADGIPFIGSIDVENLEADQVGGVRGLTDIVEAYTPDPAGTVEVIDHKTTGDRPGTGAKEYRKQGRDLVDTIQMSGYGVHEVLKRKAPFVRLSHHYYFTKVKRPADKQTALVPAERLLRRWEGVDALARTLRDVARETDPDKVPGNLAACGAFGGCPYRAGTATRPPCKVAAQAALNFLFSPALDLDVGFAPSDHTKDTHMNPDTEPGILDDIFGDAPAAPAEAPLPLRAAWDYLTNEIPAELGLPVLEGGAAIVIKELYGIKFGPSGKLAAKTCKTSDDVIALANAVRARLARDAAAPPAVQPGTTMPAIERPADDMPALTPPITATAPAPAAPTPSPEVPSAGAAPAVPAAPKKRGRPAKAATETAAPPADITLYDGHPQAGAPQTDTDLLRALARRLLHGAMAAPVVEVGAYLYAYEQAAELAGDRAKRSPFSFALNESMAMPSSVSP